MNTKHNWLSTFLLINVVAIHFFDGVKKTGLPIITKDIIILQSIRDHNDI